MMHRNPYRGKKSRKVLNGCLLVVLSLIFIVTKVFVMTWLPSFSMAERSLELERQKVSEEKYDPYLNDDVLHVVTSRFMQGQPKLRALAKARLLLFETFCLPTILNQSADNFLWFVMTDPQLDPEILHYLQSLLKPRPNFYLVASNAKLLTPSNLTKIFSSDHGQSFGTDSNQNILLTGDFELLRQKMFDPHRPLLLETRLDADDGLHSDTLRQIQTIAKALPNDTKGWQIICSNIHYEWRNDGIFVEGSNQTAISSGKLRLVKESICVTPGYTLVRHREPQNTDFPSWPKLGHNLVNREWPECRIEDESIVGKIVETNSGNGTHDCWKKMGHFPSALRSRTVTSAGMSRVETLPEESKKYENRTKLFWKLVKRDFNISPKDAISTSIHMRTNLQSIASDNLKGQW